MQRLSSAHGIGSGELTGYRLRMQRRVHGQRWGRVRGLRGGDVQGGEWHGRVHAVSGGDVLDKDGRDLGGSVQRVSGSCALAFGQCFRTKLHLQSGVRGFRRRCMQRRFLNRCLIDLGRSGYCSHDQFAIGVCYNISTEH